MSISSTSQTHTMCQNVDFWNETPTTNNSEWRAFIEKDIAFIVIIIYECKIFDWQNAALCQNHKFSDLRLYVLTQLKISNIPTNEILDTEWINKNSIRFQWIFWHIALYVPNWVHVQFWSSAKIHQTSLRFQDRIRYYKDVICRSFQFQNILDIQIL